IQAGDPELIPASTWENFQNQGQLCLNELNNYQSNRNIGHLKNANGNLDNMLTYVRPYIVEPGQAAKTAGEAFRAYSRAVSENIENLKAKTKSAIGEIEEFRQEALSKSKSIDSAAEKITGLERRYFEDSGDEQSLESSIESLYEELNHQHKEISAYYSELLGEESTSIRGRVESGLEKMDANRREIVELLEDASTKIKELNKFH